MSNISIIIKLYIFLAIMYIGMACYYGFKKNYKLRGKVGIKKGVINDSQYKRFSIVSNLIIGLTLLLLALIVYVIYLREYNLYLVYISFIIYGVEVIIVSLKSNKYFKQSL